MKTTNNTGKRTDKTFLCFAVLNTLVRYSDEEHPLTEEQIILYLEETYGIEPNRKTVGGCIASLTELGCHIEQTRKGCYLEDGCSRTRNGVRLTHP